MRLPATVRGVLLTGIILFSGAARAAYPTPGAVGLDFQVHPVSLGDAQEVLSAFLADRSLDNYSLAVDARTSSIVAVAPAEIQRELETFIQHRIAERMRRFVVRMEVSQLGSGVRTLVGEPRLEVPFGEQGTIHLDGRHGNAAVDWRSHLVVSPELNEDGTIRVHLRGTGRGQDQVPNDLEFVVKPGEPMVIDPQTAADPRVRAFARELSAGRPGGDYSLKLSVQPL